MMLLRKSGCNKDVGCSEFPIKYLIGNCYFKKGKHFTIVSALQEIRSIKSVFSPLMVVVKQWQT